MIKERGNLFQEPHPNNHNSQTITIAYLNPRFAGYFFYVGSTLLVLTFVTNLVTGNKKTLVTNM